jgi:hypothetical protein
MNEQNRNSHPSPQHSFMAIEAILNTPKTEYVSIGFVLLSGNSVPMAFSTNYVFLRASGFAGSARCGNTILSRNANATYLRSSAMVEHQSKWGDRSSAPKSRTRWTHWYQIRGACFSPYSERRSRHTYPGSSKPSGNSI